MKDHDLKAIGIYHPYVIDTHQLFSRSSQSNKLKDVVSRELGRSIQRGSHNPVEDAQAAIQLVKKALNSVVSLNSSSMINQPRSRVVHTPRTAYGGRSWNRDDDDYDDHWGDTCKDFCEDWGLPYDD